MDSLFLLVLGVVLVLDTAILVLLVTRAITIRVQSEKVYLAFQELVTCTKVDSRFWKSCRPVFMKVGSVGSIETYEFLIVLFEGVVLQITINLLLNF